MASKVDFTLDVQVRADKGKGASRRLRRSDLVPGIIYGGKAEPQTVATDHDSFMNKLKHEAFYSHILTVNIAGKPQQAILRALHRDPVKPRLLHFDLQRVSADDIIHMMVPVHFINEEIAPGVKAGGQVNHAITSLEVVCAAKNLPEYLEVDLAGLELGHSIHLTEIKLPSGVTLAELTHGEGHDHAVVTIAAPRGAAEEEAAAPAAEGEGATPAS
ncbi:MAG: 50S ribosomal protein L25/general stress protein Ctc [Pseudomonadota bacterium]